jgi:hypothetical protein
MATNVGGSTKVFEQPKEGVYLGVLADIIELGLVDGFYGAKQKVRFIWILNAKDSEGNYFRVQKSYNAVLHEKSNLYADVTDVLGAHPTIPYDLDLLLGKNNLLVLKPEQATTGPKKGQWFTNVKAVMSVPAGTALFTIPAGFVRDRDKQNGRNQQQSSPTQQQQTTQQAAPTQNQQAPAQQASLPQPPPVETDDEDIPF